MLRILGGELRGRKIPFRPRLGVRPTSHRVREALFDLIGKRIGGATFLDAFAGSGAVGIEALSRGARLATFVETQKHLVRDIGRFLEELGIRDRAALRCLDMRQSLEGRIGGLERSDIVFLDAPYEMNIMGVIESAPPIHLLETEGLLVVEMDSHLAGRYARSSFRIKRYGDSTLVLVEAEQIAAMMP